MAERQQLRRFLFSKQELALFAATILWGITFLIIHIAVQYSGPLFFCGISFYCCSVHIWADFLAFYERRNFL